MSDAKRLEPNSAYQTRKGQIVLTDPEGWVIDGQPIGRVFSTDPDLIARNAKLVEALASLTAALWGLQISDGHDGGNPYRAPTPSEGRTLLGMADSATNLIAANAESEGR